MLCRDRRRGGPIGGERRILTSCHQVCSLFYAKAAPGSQRRSQRALTAFHIAVRGGMVPAAIRGFLCLLCRKSVSWKRLGDMGMQNSHRAWHGQRPLL